MIKYFYDLEQGTEEWLAARRGLLTASEMHFIITPKLKKAADNDKEKSHLYELLAQRITGFTEDTYVSDDMARGHPNEAKAKKLYSENYEPIMDCGLIINDRFGFKIGCSPDGLVGTDGMVECKSRRQKYQTETIVTNSVPENFQIQLQTALMVSERKWIDYISYSGGHALWVIRVKADFVIQEAIWRTAKRFEERLEEARLIYFERLQQQKFIPTERDKPEQEITE